MKKDTKLSDFGYQIGMRVECISAGKSHGGNSGLRSSIIMSRGDKGIITGFDGYYTEILLDGGSYCTRNEERKEQLIKIISIEEPQYEIY